MNLPSLAVPARTSSFRQYLTDLLVDICRIDTTPTADVGLLARNEGRIFSILERHLEAYGFEQARAQWRPISPAIEAHPFFSQLYYTQGKHHPRGLSCRQTYEGRFNLLFMVDGEERRPQGVSQAINAHIDVIAPYFPPRLEGDTVFGRGACDDKGNVVALMGALKLVADHLRQSKQRLNRHLTAMFVIEEEMGGNGSLSLALDRQLKQRYDSLMVLEICENRIYPGNRGCVWFKVEGKLPGVNLFEAAAFIIEELEKEGRALKSESRHDLFPHRPVQTCHGMIGACGEHPSRINARVSFDVAMPRGRAGDHATRQLLVDVIDFAIEEYCGRYGDKTKVPDLKTAKPKVDHHYDLQTRPGGYRVTLHGSSGHMGSILENDGAITKMATVLRGLVRSRAAIARAAGVQETDVSFTLADWADPSHLVMEGGQGFLPTHEMEQVMARVRQAACRGAQSYLTQIGRSEHGEDVLQVTFNKLHNAAFARSADSPEMRHARDAARAAGMWKDEPIRGWDVSCDARIFAQEYPQVQVLTSGPGSLRHAHSDIEQISIPEMLQFSEFLAYYILLQTGTLHEQPPGTAAQRGRQLTGV